MYENLRNSPEWRMALDNLEQMHPQYLASLLRESPSQLERVLRERVLAYHRTLERLRKAAPNEEEERLREIALSEHMPVNPDWQDQEPLNREENGLLRQFLRES